MTAQHLLLDRRDQFNGGFRPDTFWWPIIQRREDRDELRALAAAGLPFVWLGSDSAPHPLAKKRADCCAGGVLMAHAGIEFYVEVFETMGALDRLEEFASINGPAFFGYAPSSQTLSLVREDWTVRQLFLADDSAPGSGVEVVPFRLGGTVAWKLA